MAEKVDISGYLPLIRDIDMLRFLSEADIQRLFSFCQVLAFQHGDRIVTQGEASDHLFAVVQGALTVSVRELSRVDIVINSISAGEVFGETAIFTGEPRTATVTAAQDSVVLSIHRKDLLGFIRDHPLAGNKVLMVMVLSLIKRLKKTSAELAFEKQPEIDFDYVDRLIQDFMAGI